MMYCLWVRPKNENTPYTLFPASTYQSALDRPIFQRMKQLSAQAAKVKSRTSRALISGVRQPSGTGPSPSPVVRCCVRVFGAPLFVRDPWGQSIHRTAFEGGKLSDTADQSITAEALGHPIEYQRKSTQRKVTSTLDEKFHISCPTTE